MNFPKPAQTYSPYAPRPLRPVELVSKQVPASDCRIVYKNGKPHLIDIRGERKAILSLPKVRGYYE